MATDTVAVKLVPRLPGRRFDHLFFSVMSLLMLAAAFWGFAHTYFLAGVFRAPLPNLLIHVHGAAFSCWILLLIVQTSLVSAGRVDIHRRLGIAGFILGCSMVILGVLAATDALRRGDRPPIFPDAKSFYLVPLADMVIFGTLLFFAFRYRRDSPAHKRMIYIATAALLDAAFARLPVGGSTLNAHLSIAALCSAVFVLILVIYDLWSTHKVHRATLWAGAFMIFVQQIRLPIAGTVAWHDFAARVQNLVR
jgi:FtsH-binding integral membrane protein